MWSQELKCVRGKGPRVLRGVSLELVALCSKGWGTSWVCPLLSQPSLGTGIAPSSSECSVSLCQVGEEGLLGIRAAWR